MDFLVNSKLSAYFEFEPSEADPFLNFFYFKNSNSDLENEMQVTEDLLPQVKHGQYLILQDLIYYNINSVYLKNLSLIKQEKEAQGKIRGVYGIDYSQPPFKTKRISISKLTQRLYSPLKNSKSKERPGTTNRINNEFYNYGQSIININ